MVAKVINLEALRSAHARTAGRRVRSVADSGRAPTPFPASPIQTSQFPASQFPASQFPATQFPATQFPATQFPATQFPASRVPATSLSSDSGPGVSRPVAETETVTTIDAALALTLLNSLTDGSHLLSQLTGLTFTDGQEPDLLAVRSGREICATLAGGFTTAGWTDTAGNTVTWFATGQQPHAYQGVVVLYAAASSREERIHTRRIALDGLAQHLSSARQRASREWHQHGDDAIA